MGPIVLLTDFGQSDGYVGVMKGVIHSIAPAATVIDLSHEIAQADIQAASFVLWNQHRFFPADSIFVCVVDPGVGSDRAIIAVKTDRHIFLVPDNGVLDLILCETRAHTILKVENPAFFRQGSPSSTFHGRDIFAPTAAHLATGGLFTQLGPIHSYRLPACPFEDMGPGVAGSILHIDTFGNLITNLRQSAIVPSGFRIGDRQIPRQSHYGAVSRGELLSIAASHGLWEIACRDGSAHDILDLSPDTMVHPYFLSSD